MNLCCSISLTFLNIMNTYIPECTNPFLLVNRAAINYIFHGGDVFINNKQVFYLDKSNLSLITTRFILNLVKRYSIDTCYVRFHGVDTPLAIYVPCGNCPICRHKKYVDFIQRCQMESQLYDCPPFFFTLTYAPKYLPKNSELCYRDVQLFFKRLRRKWSYMGLDTNIRYVVASEYGSKSILHRPHYHVILWNNPYRCSEFQPELFYRLKDDVFTAWGMCEPQAFDFGQCASGAAAYAAKYISKPPLSYGRVNKPKIRQSTLHGGIGYPLILQHIDYFRKNPHLREFQYLTKDNKLNTVTFGSYISTHIWPSPIRLVPPRCRDAYKQFIDVLKLAWQWSVLPFEKCYDYAELMRPFKNVVVNSFNVKDLTQQRFVGACFIYRKNRVSRLLDCLANDILIDYKDKLIDEEYIKMYFNYKSQPTPAPAVSRVSSRLLDIRQKLAVQKDKETL